MGTLVRAARTLGFNALNITHPCKQLVVEHLDALDERAARLGAVNTVIFGERGAVGYNTDASGFATAFRTGLPGAPVSEVVQLGAGGAGAAVADALLSDGTEHLTVVDVDVDRATAPRPGAGRPLPDSPRRRRRDRQAGRCCCRTATDSSTAPRPGWPTTRVCPSTRTSCTTGSGSPTSSTGR